MLKAIHDKARLAKEQYEDRQELHKSSSNHQLMGKSRQPTNLASYLNSTNSTSMFGKTGGSNNGAR